MFKAGDRVAYSKGFCQSTFASREITKMRGTVVAVKSADMSKFVRSRRPPLLSIRWDGESDPRSSLSSNIRKV